MSGVISPFGRSGVITDVKGLTIRAYCRVNANNPSSTAFERSYNIASISHGTTDFTINFIEPVVSPYIITNFYGLSTGSHVRFILTASESGLRNSISMAYRIMNNSGSIATSNDNLNGASIAVYGGIGS